MNLTVTIESAESRFKQMLEDFFITVFDEKNLESHGIAHHRRVWKYATELTLLLADHNGISDPDIFNKLIIACYLHDTGMSIDSGIIHGHHSKEICIRFLKKNNLVESDYESVLFAIENHDRKEYNPEKESNQLLNILSIADDLDAFGFIGIYRYSEIYLNRRIKTDELGYLIIQNALLRYKNFKNIFSFSEDLVKKHKSRYLILENFFAEYNQQVTKYKFTGNNPEGYCGVIELFISMINSNLSINELCQRATKLYDDKIIQSYFKELLSEIS